MHSRERATVRGTQLRRCVAAVLLPVVAGALGCESSAGRVVTAFQPFVPDQVVEVELPDGVLIRAGSFNVFGGRIADATVIGDALSGIGFDLLGLQECPDEVFARTIGDAIVCG